MALTRLVGALLLGFTSSTAWPLGLGDLEVRSRLNQPLDATIRLLGATAEEIETLRVRLAGADSYHEAGIDRADYLSTLNFAVVPRAGSPYIAVSSEAAAREPMLSLYVDARWSEGRLLREYAVLLDPPPAEPARVPSSGGGAPTAPPIVAAAPAAVPRPKPAPSQSTGDEFFETAEEAQRADPSPELLDRFGNLETGQSTATAPAAGAEGRAMPPTYGPVKRGETLWRVAYNLRPDPSISMDQMQVAIFDANPEAFEDGRLTGLLAGRVLTVPSLAQVRAVDLDRAQRLVAAARAGTSATPAPRSATPEPPPPEPEPMPEPPEPEAPEPEAPQADEPPVPREGGSALDQLQREYSEQRPSPAVDAPPPPAPAPEALAPAAPPSEPMFEEPERPERSAPVRRPPPDEGPPWLWIGLAVLLLILLPAPFILRRRKPKFAVKEQFPVSRGPAAAPPAAPATASEPAAAAPAEDEDAQRLASLEDSLVDLPAPDGEAPEGAGAPAIEDSLVDDEPPSGETVEMPAIDPVVARRQSAGVDFDVTSQFEADTMRIDLDSNDPIAEAEFHTAYGLYDEAALLLAQAAENAPERLDIRLKLAETYFAANKPVEFLETAEGLQGQLDEGDWQKVVIMGRQLTPDAAMFATAAPSAEALDSSIDIELEPDPAGPEPAVPTAEAPADPPGETPGDLALDDIRFDDAAGAPPPQAAPSVPEFEQTQMFSAAPTPPSGAAEASAQPERPAAEDDAVLDFRLEDFELASPAEEGSPPAAPESADGDKAIEFDLSDFDVQPPSEQSSEATPFEESSLAELDLSEFDAGAVDLSTGTEDFERGDVGPAPPEFAPAPAEGLPEPLPESPAGDLGPSLELPSSGEDFDAVASADLDFSAGGGDEAATKLDLARAYVDIGDNEMARSLLGEVVASGNDEQRQAAEELLTRV